MTSDDEVPGHGSDDGGRIGRRDGSDGGVRACDGEDGVRTGGCGEDGGVTRRRLLAALGATSATAGLAGCPLDGDPGDDRPTSTPSTPERPPTVDDPPTGTPFDDRRTVDVVEAGASAEGDEPIESVVEPLLADETVVYFPPGEYLVSGPIRATGLTNLAVVGDDATIRVEEEYVGLVFGLGGDRNSSGVTVQGLTFDVSASDTGVRPVDARVTDGLHVRDVSVTGRQDVDQDAARFDVTDEDGVGVVERLTLPDGGDPAYPITGCYVGESHVGTLRFVDCHVAGFPDNGLYASPATGRVVVEGGLYENNGVASVRVSGPATIRGATVRCDSAPEGYRNMRGIRLREGSDVLVEDCHVELTEVTGSDGAITLSNWLEAATIRSTSVRVDAAGVPAILAKPPAETPGGDGEYRLRVEDVTVEGAADDAAAIQLLGREGCLVEGTCIRQTGSERNGVYCTGVTDSTLRDSAIAVTGSPVVLDDATVTRRDLDTEQLRDGDDEGISCS